MISISEKEFQQLADYVKSNYGINLNKEKKALVVGRLQNVLMQNNFKSFSQYYKHILSDSTGEAAVTLVNRLTTNHTFFMREVEHFDYFRTTVLPYLASVEKKQKDLRIWSAGCSTGEEPYTLAMIIADYLGLEKDLWDSKVLATDISAKALGTAVAGVYPNEELLNLPKQWRQKYFRSMDDKKSLVTEKIRGEVVFRSFNLMNRNFPFRKKFHVIFCRNVMIYFDPPTKRDLVNRFYDFMEPGGYLFIGHSESLNRNETNYKYIMPAVYRKE